MVLRVREGNLFRFRRPPMRVVTNRNREIDEEEHVAPQVVRQLAPPEAQVQRKKVVPLVMK